jgi:Phosphoketolase
VDVPAPGATTSEATRVLGTWLRDVIRDNPSNFRLFGPDETESNRLTDVYEATDKQFEGGSCRGQPRGAGGRVMEVLSSTCARGGWRATC